MTIDVWLNGELREVSSDLTVEALLDKLALPRMRVAVELNKAVVRKQDWQKTLIADGDTIEIIHLVGGG